MSSSEPRGHPWVRLPGGTVLSSPPGFPRVRPQVRPPAQTVQGHKVVSAPGSPRGTPGASLGHSLVTCLGRTVVVSPRGCPRRLTGQSRLWHLYKVVLCWKLFGTSIPNFGQICTEMVILNRLTDQPLAIGRIV